MTPAQVSVIAALIVVAGATATVRAVRPAAPTPTSWRARFEPVPVRAQRRERLSRSIAASPVGEWLRERFAEPLRILGLSVTGVVGRMLSVMATTLIATLLILSVVVGLGLMSPSPWLLLAVTGGVVIAGWSVLSSIQTAARQRQREMRRAVNDFVQLIAVALTTSRSIEQSVRFAADVGAGAGFDTIRKRLTTARVTGQSPWEALASLGERYGLPGLVGFAGAVQRQAMMGTSVERSVREEAERLRNEQLNDLNDNADQANANLSLPTMGMVFGMMLFLAYPIVLSISEAFST